MCEEAPRYSCVTYTESISVIPKGLKLMAGRNNPTTLAQPESTQEEPTNAEKIRALPWSIVHNGANTIFAYLTFFGSVFVLLLSELGLNKSQIGFLLSPISFSAIIALFIAPAVARFGYKRTFLTFWGVRKVVAAFMLFTPWIWSHFGAHVTLMYVAGIVVIFSICRAVAMTARYPWVQEYVPNLVRGKYTAVNSVLTGTTGFLTVSGAGYIVERSSGLGRFMILFAVGVLFGLISVVAAAFIPGGASIEETGVNGSARQEVKEAIRDRGFVRFQTGVSLVTLAWVPMTSFLPLYMQEQVRLSSGNVVLLQAGTLSGGLLSSYVWGWASDRYSGKPVMLSGLSVLAVLPLCWLLMPRDSVWSLHTAMGIAFLHGLGNMGWGIGSSRLFFVKVVPPEKKTGYMALHYALMGAIGGLSQLIGGRVLDYSEGVTGHFLMFPLDQYTALFVAGLALSAVSIRLLREVQADNTVTVSEFAGMFFRGNPFLAAESLVRYHLAKGEHATVSTTERLGRAGSPLTTEELLEALSDPRFNVRFEAIISIARMDPEDRLIETLAELLQGREPAFSVMAAWALGRIGDRQAIKPLRQALYSDYRSVKVHSARSLGTLGDTESIPLLLECLANEVDCGLRMAYASTLGQLRAKEATDSLLTLLRTRQGKHSRMEVALALARIVGDEPHFIRLLRHVRVEPGTAASQAITSLKERIDERLGGNGDLETAMDSCAEALARGELETGAALMRRVICLLPRESFGEPCTIILRDCAERLDEFGATRMEYLLLALHVVNAGVSFDYQDW